MNNLCDLCLSDVSQCKKQNIVPCNYIPKYNLCPICNEMRMVYEPICYKCGYEFKTESEVQDADSD